MSPEQSQYHAIASALPGAEESQMFGKPCFKVQGKAFVCFFDQAMVFKLSGDAHHDALQLPGATLFDPSGKGRAMKEWVQVPAAQAGEWAQLASEAWKYVGKK